MADAKPRRRRLLRWILIILAVVVLPPAGATAYALLKLRATVLHSVPAPEAATGLRAVDARTFPHAMVVAAHPEAARLGNQVLEAGGSAIDAAVAVQATLTLVEPQSSGIGGGAFLLYYDAPSGKLTAWDGREVAPASATPQLFLDANGKPLNFPQAMLGGRSVGVPGALRMLAKVHARHGQRPWSELFTGAAGLAQEGFAVTPRLSTLLSLDPALPALPGMRAYFFGPDGWPHPPGTRLPNPALAQTLRTIGSEGVDAFYGGPIAADIVAAVHGATRPSLPRGLFNAVARQWGVAAHGTPTVDAPGGLSLDDLAKYEALEREPLCVPYRKFRICSAPPPAGGVSLLQLMRLLEPHELSALKPGSAEELHLLLDAAALVEADRDRWVADPAFAHVPTEGLLDPGYLQERGKLLTRERALKGATAGQPPGALAAAQSGQAFEVASTSHFVIVDAQGSVATMTTSIEFGFGAHVMVRGFLLNNQLTDFAFTPEKEGKPVFNAVAPGKRPRSAMSPTLVFDAQSNRPLLALGSPGGPRIIGYVAQALVGVLDHGLSPNAALAAPHVVYSKGKAEVEDVGWADAQARDALVQQLQALGHDTVVTSENSGLHAVVLSADALSPGIDPRREGAAAGR